MLYWLGCRLESLWGPFRLLSSHLVLLALGTMFSALVTWYFLPKLWGKLPVDKGKKLASDGGGASQGKPTGAGLLITLLLLPAIILFMPLGSKEIPIVAALYASMWFGFADDASRKPWGELRKGLLDFAVALLAAVFIWLDFGSTIWIPGTKELFTLSPWLYISGATVLLWFTMNATNCSDGVDGLAGSLTLGSLLALASILYGVIGYAPVAEYLLVPHNPNGARWAIFAIISTGSIAGYLWHNAEPSKVLMGDAGSRFFGMLVGVIVLTTGNPLLVFIVAPVVLVNGGTGLGKLVLLRFFKRLGFDVRNPSLLTEEARAKQPGVVKLLHKVRFPLHDHFRKYNGWSNAQVLMRFVLIQAFLTPLLFVLSLKIR